MPRHATNGPYKKSIVKLIKLFLSDYSDNDQEQNLSYLRDIAKYLTNDEKSEFLQAIDPAINRFSPVGIDFTNIIKPIILNSKPNTTNNSITNNIHIDDNKVNNQPQNLNQSEKFKKDVIKKEMIIVESPGNVSELVNDNAFEESNSSEYGMEIKSTTEILNSGGSFPRIINLLEEQIETTSVIEALSDLSDFPKELIELFEDEIEVLSTVEISSSSNELVEESLQLFDDEMDISAIVEIPLDSNNPLPNQIANFLDIEIFNKLTVGNLNIYEINILKSIMQIGCSDFTQRLDQEAWNNVNQYLSGNTFLSKEFQEIINNEILNTKYLIENNTSLPIDISMEYVLNLDQLSHTIQNLSQHNFIDNFDYII